MPKEPSSNQLSALSAAVLVGQLGLVVVVPVLGGVLLGVWLDARLGTRAIFTLGLLLLGLAAGARGAWLLIMREVDRESDNPSD